jgi:hypothetical protein
MSYDKYMKQLKARIAKRETRTPRNLSNLKKKGKRLYLMLYLPTGAYIVWNEKNDEDSLIAPKRLTPEGLVEMFNSWSIYSQNYFVERNGIIRPVIAEHFERTELIYR